MNVADAIRQAAKRLSETSDTARLDAELLLAHALQVSRSEMLLQHQSSTVPSEFEALITRRLRHEPIAYILEEAEFYGRSFYVNSSVLIPRSDSETIVEAALEHAPAQGRVLDMGTGSGALLLTLLAERPEMEGVGIDSSFDALQVAALNAQRLGLGNRARILKRDWHEVGWSDDLGGFELILCNPPYVEDSADISLNVRDFEPAAALFAGLEGLDDYRVIIPQLAGLLAHDGVAVLEIGYQQAENVTKIAEEAGFKVDIDPIWLDVRVLQHSGDSWGQYTYLGLANGMGAATPESGLWSAPDSPIIEPSSRFLLCGSAIGLSSD